MKIDRSEVLKISKLANLSFTREELDKFTEEFQTILDYFEKLNEINTENVEPNFHVLDLNTPLRQDLVEKGMSREAFFQNVKYKLDNQVLVPKIIGGVEDV